MVMLLSLVFCYIAISYFGTPDFVVKPIDKVNIIYSAPFFIAGGMVFLYRQGLKIQGYGAEQQNCKVSEWHQYGDLSLPHDVLSCGEHDSLG